MASYYNEIDPFAAQWLRNLISAGHIAPGEVDERSIEDVRPDDLRGFKQCHFFAGIGGWSYALRLAGWPDDKPVWSASLPCQPFSPAGKGLGFSDERHLWPSFEWIRRICKPNVLFGEQSGRGAGATWIDNSLSSLEEDGYTCGALVLQAAISGAWQARERFYFVADRERVQQPRKESRGREAGRMERIKQSIPWNEPWKSALSRFRAMDDGVPRNVAATDAARNAIVPQVAAEFIGAYMEISGEGV